jgi:uncharacterized protein DUF5674
MKIITDAITLSQLKDMAEALFGNMVKGVVDVERGIVAVDAELHADLEALLMEDGSKQSNLWGVNFYPELTGDDFLEFDSMINVRPSQGNKSRSVDDPNTRTMIIEIVDKRILR